jgi:hypothetical protein
VSDRHRQIQVVLATPLHKASRLLPPVDSVRTTTRKNNRSFVIEIDDAEIMRHIEAQQREAKQNVAEQASYIRGLGGLFSMPANGISDLLHR